MYKELEGPDALELCGEMNLSKKQISSITSLKYPLYRGKFGSEIFNITNGKISRAEIARVLEIHYSSVNEACKKYYPEKIRKREWVGEAENFYARNSDKKFVIKDSGRFYLDSLEKIYDEMDMDYNHRIKLLRKLKRPVKLDEVKKEYNCHGLYNVMKLLELDMIREIKPRKKKS